MEKAMDDPPVSPPGIDTSVPNVARVYDALLGGKDNFAVDRAQAAKLIEFDLGGRPGYSPVPRPGCWSADPSRGA